RAVRRPARAARREGDLAAARPPRSRRPRGAGRVPRTARSRQLGGLRGGRGGRWTRSDPRAIVARGGPGSTDPWMEKGVTRLTGWQVGIALGVVVILVAAVIVITIVRLAARSAKQAETAVGAVDVLRNQTDSLAGIEQINDSGVRILHSARALRK